MTAPVRDNFGTCLQATGVSRVEGGRVVYIDVDGKELVLPLTPAEAKVLKKKHEKK